MERDKQIEAIRQKCIEAGAEAGIQCHLADVLLARVKSFKEISRDYDLNPIVSDSPEDKAINQALIEIVRKWNLRKDDLTEQSDECLTFINSLLNDGNKPQ